MPATQISFADFAQATCPIEVWCGCCGAVVTGDHCLVCTPPVTDTAIAVVAHPLAVGGGECSPLGVFNPVSRMAASQTRDDFWDSGLEPGWGALGMDAPEWLPLGGARTFACGSGLITDGYARTRF